MKARSDVLPLSRVEVDTIGGKTVVTLWDGTYTSEVVVDENGFETMYVFELYQLEAQDRPGLAEAVEANFEKWLAAAKQHEEDEKMANAAIKAANELDEALPDILLDLDFRLMMKEEFSE